MDVSLSRVDGVVVAFAHERFGPDYFQEGRGRIVASGKVGFIDEHGVVVVAPSFDHAEGFCLDRAVVCIGCTRVGSVDDAEMKGGKWGIIDGAGQWTVPLQVGEIEADSGSFRRTGEATFTPIP